MSPTAFALFLLLLTILSLAAPRAARAQWAPCRADGTLLQPGDPGYNSDGSATLFGSSLTPNVSNTYPSPLDDWQSYPYSPQTPLPTPYLNVSCNSNNYYLDPSNGSRGIYNPGQYDRRESCWYTGTPVPLVVGSVSTTLDGAINAYFKYVGSGSPPDHADFLVTSSLSASVSPYSANYPASSQQASKLTGTATASLGQDTVTAAAPGQTSAQQTHHRLVRAQVSGGIATVTLSGSATATADNHFNPYVGWLMPSVIWNGPNTSVSAGASASAAARQDSREVTISSSIGQTYHKGNNNVPELNVRAGDGSITDDTVVPDPSTGTSVTYQAHRAGTWGSDSTYTWACSLTNYGSSGVFNSSSLFGNQTIPDFSGVYNNPPATAGKSDTVTLTLTDGSDGSVGSNTATVKFHNLTENWYLWNTGNLFWQGATADNVASPGYAFHNAGIAATWEYTDTVWAQAGAAFTSVAGNMLPNLYWAGLCAAASIAFSQTKPQQINQTVNFNDAWTDSNSTFNPQPIDNTADTMKLYQMVPELYIQYQPQFWRGDGYGVNGYTGGVSTAFDKYLRVDTAGDFTLVTSDPTGGH